MNFTPTPGKLERENRSSVELSNQSVCLSVAVWAHVSARFVTHNLRGSA